MREGKEGEGTSPVSRGIGWLLKYEAGSFSVCKKKDQV